MTLTPQEIERSEFVERLRFRKEDIESMREVSRLSSLCEDFKKFAMDETRNRVDLQLYAHSDEALLSYLFCEWRVKRMACGENQGEKK